MKTNNLFRFVAIRPPTTKGHIKKPIIPLEADDAIVRHVQPEIVASIRKWHAKYKVPGEALLRTGRDIIYSQDYYTATAQGKALIAATEKVQALLQKGTNNPTFHGFQDAVHALLAPIAPSHLTLDTLFTSQDYQMVKRSLWISYYASVLNPHERPQDREEIVSWLLLFHLLESENEEEFNTRIRHLAQTRPAVPYAFFALADESERLPELPLHPIPQPEVRRLKELEARITSLQNAQRTLQDLFVVKQRPLMQAHPPIKLEQPLASAEQLEGQLHEEVVDAQPAVTSKQPEEQWFSTIVGSSDVTLLPPWQVTDEDLDGNAEAFQVVRSLGLIPEVTPLPDLINRLGGEIATLNAEASRLKTRDEIMLVGKTFVKVRRPLFSTDEEEDMHETDD